MKTDLEKHRIAYLDSVRATKFAHSYKQKTFELLAVREGAYLLDVGCGTGDDVLALARLVGRLGKVVGLDLNPTMIKECRRRESPELGVAFQVGDARWLPFLDNSFDGCRADRLLQHVEEPGSVITEMIRVSRVGARIVVSEPDWGTLAVDAADRSVTRRIANFICDWQVRHGWIGRQLATLFRTYGLADVTSAADVLIITHLQAADHIWGFRRHAARAREMSVISNTEYTQWIAGLEQADRAGGIFAAMVGFAACGIKGRTDAY